MKVQPFLFYLVLGLGLVCFALCFDCCFADSPGPAPRQDSMAPERISSSLDREVRVFLKTQRFGFYEKGVLKFSGAVCTGKKGYETPRGKFRVLTKARNYYSRKYDGAPMPFAVQFSTSGCFIHVGEISSQPSSHGCVRLSEKDAIRIFGAVKIGDSVVITE